MSSIKKVLCLKANNDNGRTFTVGNVYDVEPCAGGYYRTNDDHGLLTAIFTDMTCLYGEWQPLEEYVCMTHTLKHKSKPGDILYGYEDGGVIKFPHNGMIVSNISGLFQKLHNLNSFAINPRHEVRHVIYDAKDNKVVNDAMGECYITLAEAQEVCDEMNAPKVMKPKYTKEVEYFGMKLLVPDDAKFIATTSYGSVLTCNSSMHLLGQNWNGELSSIAVVGFADLNGIDWKETLVEIK